MSIFIKEILEEFLKKEFFTYKKEIESSPIKNQLSNYVHKQIQINSNIHLNYMKVFYQNSSNLCGYHCLFYGHYYIKYILSGFNCYYLWKMNSSRKFWTFYKKEAMALVPYYKEDEYLIKELMNEGALEREQMNYLIESRSDLFPLLGGGDNIHFHYNTIDYICGQFLMEDSKVIQIQMVIDGIKKKNNKNILCDEKNVYLFFIGITNHWILFVVDCSISCGINYYVFDSCDTSTEVLMLKADKDKTDYIEKMNQKDQEVYKKKPLTDYEKKSFYDWIKDMNSFLNIFPLIIENDNKQIELTLPYIVLHKAISLIITSYESYLHIFFKDCSNDENIISIFDKETDMTEVLLQLYMWLLSEYPPLALESLIIPKLILFKVNYQLLYEPLLKFTILNIILIDKYSYSVSLEDSEELYTKFKKCLIKIREVVQIQSLS